jgi:hypothetical protein
MGETYVSDGFVLPVDVDSLPLQERHHLGNIGFVHCPEEGLHPTPTDG